MDFYTLDYIISHQSTDSARRVAAILFLLLVGLVFSALYLRDKVRTRWRDAGVGAIVLSLVLLGIQTASSCASMRRTTWSTSMTTTTPTPSSEPTSSITTST